jgi:hypothetical protein
MVLGDWHWSCAVGARTDRQARIACPFFVEAVVPAACGHHRPVRLEMTFPRESRAFSACSEAVNDPGAVNPGRLPQAAPLAREKDPQARDRMPVFVEAVATRLTLKLRRWREKESAGARSRCRFVEVVVPTTFIYRPLTQAPLLWDFVK